MFPQYNKMGYALVATKNKNKHSLKVKSTKSKKWEETLFIYLEIKLFLINFISLYLRTHSFP